MRDSAWYALGRWITQKDWTSVFEANTCKDKFNLFFSDLSQALDRLLPQKVIKKHPTDRPWITNKIKKWIYKRQSAFTQKGKKSSAYRF